MRENRCSNQVTSKEIIGIIRLKNVAKQLITSDMNIIMIPIAWDLVHDHTAILIPLSNLKQAHQCMPRSRLKYNCNKDIVLYKDRIYLIRFLPSVQK